LPVVPSAIARSHTRNAYTDGLILSSVIIIIPWWLSTAMALS
jgi:hypothetical protein